MLFEWQIVDKVEKATKEYLTLKKQQLEQPKSEVSFLHAEVDVLKKLFVTVNSKLTTTEKELNEQKSKNDKLEKEVKQLNEHKMKHQKLENECNLMKEEVDRLKEQNYKKDKLQHSYKLLKDEVNQLKSSNNTQLKKLIKIEKCYLHCEDNLQPVIQEHEKITKLIQELSKEFQSFKDPVKEEKQPNSEEKVQYKIKLL